MRRLPIFFLLDCSESMAGAKLDHMKQGLKKIVEDLRHDPHALETVYISVIAFAGKAKTIVPLIDLVSFYPPVLPIGSGTSLGAALHELQKQIDLQVKKSSPEQKGDWKPVVYLLTDGYPTDDVKPEIDRWHQSYTNKAKLIAISIGQSANLELLRSLTPDLFLFDETQDKDFRQFIQWITASISMHSQSVDGQVSEQKSNIISLAKSNLPPSFDDQCVVLTGKCSTTQKPYLIKYENYDNMVYLNKDTRRQYRLQGCFSVDEDYFAWSDDRAFSLSINTQQLSGFPSCPHCSNGVAFALCRCGHLLCVGQSAQAQCPWCQRHIQFDPDSGNEDFDVSRGRG
ncbi:TerY-C metal binding domain-containing protein [Ignatzschineria larvae DSM 13226]|uniref:TerY-C metal binding domain-containing protein n=1 Tax=Ignatzschineria larvae DSM 13226 TaxID=1111732 RepID=A0ABZ3BZ90_9GAMM|nr:TerY-C metal binding domain-containing protein [Ignatzschineria larvae]